MTSEIKYPNQKKDIEHPSSDLESRLTGFGIGGGYERPYRRNDLSKSLNVIRYGPVPHSGYYGATHDNMRFEIGQASFNQELSLYKRQFGQETLSNKKLSNQTKYTGN